jgi:hypothetical protein
MNDFAGTLNTVPGSYGAAAGKNKIINGDFYVNQRNFTSTTGFTYGLDRWYQENSGTTTYSAQTFTLGSAPVAGYEGKNFARQATTGQIGAGNFAYLAQRIESVRTLAGQTVTVSFWAKAASGTPKVSVEFTQLFGSGGSPSGFVRINFGQVTLSTSWARYSVTASITSISGKTLGTNGDDWLGLYLWTSAGSDFAARTNSLGLQNNTFDFWGVQVEAGSIATPFQTATATIQGELAACQRYYERFTSTAAYGLIGTGKAYSTSAVNIQMPFAVTKRVTPTAVDTSAMATFQFETGGTAGNTPTAIINNTGVTTPSYGQAEIQKSSPFTTGAYYFLMGNNSTNAFIGWSAEL